MPRVRLIWLLLAAYLLLGTAYSLTTPLFEAPDEQWHFAFVKHVATGGGLPIQALPLQHLARQEGSQPPLYYFAAAALTFWIDTSDYPGIAWENPHYGYNVPGIVNDNKNLFIHTAAESFPFHNTPLGLHLARLLSLFFGALAVYFTYRIALLLPQEDDVAVTLEPVREPVAAAAAALVAFTPQFLFISSALSNDSAIVAASALTLFLLVRGLRQTPTLRAALLLGSACGLGALAKVSGLAMLPLALAVVAYINRRNRQQLLLQVAGIAVAFAVIAGWWYARNLVLYGELTGTTRMLEIFGARVTPLTLDQWRAQLGEVFETFWVGFGWGNIRATSGVYFILGLGVAIGLLGLFARLVRRRRAWRPLCATHAPLLVLAAWVGIVFVSLLRWMMLTQAPHGRLLFPALPALAPLVVSGWLSLVPPRAQFLATRAAPLALFGFAALAPFTMLAPAYAYPPRLSESQLGEIPARVDIRYGDSLMLVGSRVLPHPVDPRGALQVELYWKVLKPMDRAYSLNLSALDEQYRVVGSRNSYPGHGTLPTNVLQPGELFEDTYWLPLKTPVPTGLVQVSLFERTTQQDLSAYDPAGNEITPVVNKFQLAP